MSEQEFVPNPGNESEDAEPFSFETLSVENTESLGGEFVAPDSKATRNKWWERKPKDKANQERGKRAAKPTPPMPRGGLKNALENMYTGMGMAMMPFDPHCGSVIIENAASCAESMDELAKTNPAVRRVLLRMVSTTAIGMVVAAHAPIIMAISMHHIPALRERQEKMTADMAEMFANAAANRPRNEDTPE